MELPVILYLSPFDLLRPRTNQVSDVRFSEGFAQCGCEVHLLAPYVYRPDNIQKEQLPDVYGLEADIRIHYLPHTFKKDINGIAAALLIALMDFRRILQIRRSYARRQPICVISRHSALLLPLAILKKTLPFLFRNISLVYWAHDLKYKASDRLIYSSCTALLFTNSSIRTDLLKKIHFPEARTFITLNPITAKQAAFSISRAAAREKLGMTAQHKPLVVYTGKLGLQYQREIIHILEAASLRPEADFLLTGGSKDVVAFWQQYCMEKGIENVRFTGYLPNYSDIQYYQYGADCLITYYTTQGHDPRYNLPNKICEYMLTGNILITPDYPATADLLHAGNCLFCAPESSEALAAAIQYALTHPEDCHSRAATAAKAVREITFQKQVQRILTFIRKTA